MREGFPRPASRWGRGETRRRSRRRRRRPRRFRRRFGSGTPGVIRPSLPSLENGTILARPPGAAPDRSTAGADRVRENTASRESLSSDDRVSRVRRGGLRPGSRRRKAAGEPAAHSGQQLSHGRGLQPGGGRRAAHQRLPADARGRVARDLHAGVAGTEADASAELHDSLPADRRRLGCALGPGRHRLELPLSARRV